MSIHCGTPSDCPTCLRTALAAAEAKLADANEQVRLDILNENTLQRMLADERRHADALCAALQTSSAYPGDYSTRDRAIALHAARRAAEVANG